jgi:hypothetical protein
MLKTANLIFNGDDKAYVLINVTLTEWHKIKVPYVVTFNVSSSIRTAS